MSMFTLSSRQCSKPSIRKPAVTRKDFPTEATVPHSDTKITLCSTCFYQSSSKKRMQTFRHSIFTTTIIFKSLEVFWDGVLGCTCLLFQFAVWCLAVWAIWKSGNNVISEMDRIHIKKTQPKCIMPYYFWASGDTCLGQLQPCPLHHHLSLVIRKYEVPARRLHNNS